VTGASEAAEEETEAPSPFASIERPTLVYVAHAGVGGEEDKKLEDIVFKAEKVGLAAKAFRTVRMTPEAVEKDALLAGHGSEVPRLLVVDPVKEKIEILEKGKLKAGALYDALKSAAGRFYKESLDKVVKTHLKILTERDQLANEEKTLREKETRLGEEKDAAAKKDLDKVKEEIAAVQKQLEELATKERDLWKLTPKAEQSA